ncbi:amino acid--tRNA ligase-related protein [Streptosporangium sp. DT93]|uniref:amino acid--tRNA ligase-related protein n=1 Tax=Streptosporangium sp. DT93 TaxID=3393428 RepID=UPI003CEC674F
MEVLRHLLPEFVGLPPGKETGRKVKTAGRLVGLRDFGHLCFATLRDDGEEIQLILTRDTTGDAYGIWKAHVDPGDHVVVEGEVVTSRSGTLSVRVDAWSIAAKALRPLPERTRGRRPRPRYEEMLADRALLDRIRGRDAILRHLRRHLHDDDFVEVETPLLQPVHGGTARPFVTRLNAWGADLYLGGTSELYLKRLVVGGLERLFEISRAFRNEGVDAAHFPEFTLFEGYMAHADHMRMARLVEDMLRGAARETTGEDDALREPFAREDMYDLLSREFGVRIGPESPREELSRAADSRGVAHGPGDSPARIAVLLLRKVVQPRLLRPTFVLGLPRDAAILARPSPGDERVAEAWKLIVMGTEVSQGCSELTDPARQRERFVSQGVGTGRDKRIDHEFLRALEYGLPPLAGFGIGVERLLTALNPGTRLLDHQAHPISRPGGRRRTSRP